MLDIKPEKQEMFKSKENKVPIWLVSSQLFLEDRVSWESNFKLV